MEPIPPPMPQEQAPQQVERSNAFKQVIKRGETVLHNVRSAVEPKIPKANLSKMAQTGLLLAALVGASIGGNAVPRESIFSPHAAPPPAGEVAGAAPTETPVVAAAASPTETPTPAPAAEAPKKVSDAEIAGILQRAEAESKPVLTPVEQVGPLTPEQAGELVDKFYPLYLTANQLLSEKTLQENPELNYRDFLDPFKIAALEKAGLLNVSDADENDRRNPGDKIVSFIPQGPRGSVIISYWVTEKGEVYKQDVGLTIDAAGKVTSQFRMPRLPYDQLKDISLRIYKVPEDVRFQMQWEEGRYSDPTDRSIEGHTVVNGRKYSVYNDERGYSGVTVESEEGALPLMTLSGQ